MDCVATVHVYTGRDGECKQEGMRKAQVIARAISFSVMRNSKTILNFYSFGVLYVTFYITTLF